MCQIIAPYVSEERNELAKIGEEIDNHLTSSPYLLAQTSLLTLGAEARIQHISDFV
jgi:hypothetical protein